MCVKNVINDIACALNMLFACIEENERQKLSASFCLVLIFEKHHIIHLIDIVT